jgi:hypothetical protein
LRPAQARAAHRAASDPFDLKFLYRMSDKKFELVDRSTERKAQLPVRNGTIGPSVVDISSIQKDLGVFT